MMTGEMQIAPEALSDFKKRIRTVKDAEHFLSGASNQDISSALQMLLAGAVVLSSSDVHLEPLEDHARVRFRIDGLLQDVAQLSKTLHEALLSRTKLLSGIKLNVTDRPQDGRFSLGAGTDTIELRVATLPSEHGEAVVLRILNPKALIGLGELGLRKDLLSLFEREIRKPNGMIVVTGPTGSGKTTTLYAFLREVQDPSLKIITIEDPIEYHLEGISQTQVDEAKKYTFASGLRAIVRQDPDVILVGEVRDGETADIALQASLTGHLVFSTLHTNDAAGTVARFLALGAKVSTVASALNLIVAQRLVRKVCKECGMFVAPTPEEKQKIQKTLHLKIPKAKACAHCNFTGYRGRIGIFEAIEVDDEMEEFILSSPSMSKLKAFAIKKGMVPMYQDGIFKILEGITTFEELERVIAE